MAINKVDPADPNFSFVAKHIVAQAAALSTCRRRKAGAAVFDLTGRLLATGHNKERPDDAGATRSCWNGDCPRGLAAYAALPADSPYGDCIADHAEIVALSKAYGTANIDEWLTEPDIHMITSHRPCHQCTAVIERFGISTFYLEEM